MSAPDGGVAAADVEIDRYLQGEAGYHLANAAILVIYVVWSYVWESWPSMRWFHQTTVAMCCGIVAGFVFHCTGATVKPSLNPTVVMEFALPLIMLKEGYNMRVRMVLEQSPYVVLLGLFGSLAMFILLSYLYQLPILNRVFWPIAQSTRHRLAMAMVLTASDTVAPLALLPKDRFPRLNAIVFGEAVLNDVVCLFLSSSLGKLKGEEPRAVDILTQACIDIMLSTLVGCAWGFATTGILGCFREKLGGAPYTRPAVLVLLSCSMVYACSEELSLSGVMVIFVAGAACKHGVSVKLDPGVDHFLEGVTETLGYLAESFLYGYFGLAFVTEVGNPGNHRLVMEFSLFVGLQMTMVACRVSIVAVVRLLGQLGAKSARLHRWCAPLEQLGTLGAGETTVVAATGLFRGVLAAVLVLRVLPYSPAVPRLLDDLVRMSVLTIVVFHVVVASPLLLTLTSLFGIKGEKEAPEGGDGAEGAQCGEEADVPSTASSATRSTTRSGQTTSTIARLQDDLHVELAQRHSAPEATVAGYEVTAGRATWT